MPDESQETHNSSDNVATLVEEAIEAEPTVREEIVNRLQQEAESNSNVDDPCTNPAPTPTPHTSPATTFDPSIHEVDKFGRPVLTKAGHYRRKRGKKAGTQTHTQPVSAPQESVSSAPPANYAQLGSMATELLFGVSQTLFGEAWKPQPTEREQITNAAVRFCEANDIADIPPGIALVLCVAMYAAPRIATDEETQRRLRKFGTSIGLVRETVDTSLQPEPMDAPQGIMYRPPYGG